MFNTPTHSYWVICSNGSKARRYEALSGRGLSTHDWSGGFRVSIIPFQGVKGEFPATPEKYPFNSIQ